MNLEEYRTVFATCSLVLTLIAAAPTFSLVTFPDASAHFSELWVLDSNQTFGDYPFNVRVNETYSLYVGVGNHMGGSMYYTVYVKFRNQTQPLPDVSNSTPSPLLPLHEYQFFIADEETWDSKLTFEILDATAQDESMLVGDVSINGVTFPVNRFSTWDSEKNGFYYQLFFELWLYDLESRSFQFHDRYVTIWLNMTAS